MKELILSRARNRPMKHVVKDANAVREQYSSTKRQRSAEGMHWRLSASLSPLRNGRNYVSGNVTDVPTKMTISTNYRLTIFGRQLRLTTWRRRFWSESANWSLFLSVVGLAVHRNLKKSAFKRNQRVPGVANYAWPHEHLRIYQLHERGGEATNVYDKIPEVIRNERRM